MKVTGIAMKQKIALTLHFYSPKAYDYVRSILCLPHPLSTLRWKSSVNCEPGFFQEVFLQLQKMIENSPDENEKCCNERTFEKIYFLFPSLS